MGLKRRAFALAVLREPQGGILVMSSDKEAYHIINDYAPEDLHLLSTRPFGHLPYLCNVS